MQAIAIFRSYKLTSQIIKSVGLVYLFIYMYGRKIYWLSVCVYTVDKNKCYHFSNKYNKVIKVAKPELAH